MDWNPISTAPKDRGILLFGREGVAVGSWTEGPSWSGWFVSGAHSYWSPEFWMEIPPTPELKPQGEGIHISDLKPIDWAEEDQKLRAIMQKALDDFYHSRFP